MNYLLLIAASTVISLAIIPIMIRLAPAWGMIDQPDARKVHANPIPRIGGWGIVIGALIPIATLLPLDRYLQSYIFGALILLAFGAADDRREMGHYTKFIGQFLAVIPVVAYAGLYVKSLPFIGDIPAFIGMPFTIIAIIGLINAINHSDGLDGLAGGESMLSFAAIALLAYFADADSAIVITAASIGGILGFLRYNTHPAIVFMGDGGSQFLGFTLAFLAVLLTQNLDTTLSPAVVILLLGLPIADILVVAKKRMQSGNNVFVATKNHIHHRLLEIGFVHKESVIIIYCVHTLLVACGVWMRHLPDLVIIATYLAITISLFASIGWAEKNNWKPNTNPQSHALHKKLMKFDDSGIMVWGPRRFLEYAIPLYFVSVSIWANHIPRDFGIVATLLGAVMLLNYYKVHPFSKRSRRFVIYLVSVFVIYLAAVDRPTWGRWWVPHLEIFFYTTIAMATAFAIRFSPRRRKEEFEVTALDYLMAFAIFAVLLFSRHYGYVSTISISTFVVGLGIMLYGCELLIVERKDRIDLLGKACFTTLCIIAARGLGLININIHF